MSALNLKPLTSAIDSTKAVNALFVPIYWGPQEERGRYDLNEHFYMKMSSCKLNKFKPV
jgi:hypothetical protein